MERKENEDGDFARRLRYHGILEYILTISNESKYKITEVMAINVLPSNVQYNFSEPLGLLTSAENGSSVISWKIGSIFPNCKQKIYMQLQKVKTGTRLNIVKIKGTIDDFPNMKPVEITEFTPIPEFPGCTGCFMEIRAQSSKSQCKIGEKITYRIEIVNSRTSHSTNIKLENIVPENMEFIDAVGPTSFEFRNGKAIFAPVPSLAVNERISYEVTCKAIKPGLAKNLSVMKFDQRDIELEVEEGTCVTE